MNPEPPGPGLTSVARQWPKVPLGTESPPLAVKMEDVTRHAETVRRKHGPVIGWPEVLRIMEDRSCVRYPCVVQFDSVVLLPGEFAYSVRRGSRPEDGFVVFIHPMYRDKPAAVDIALYQLALVHYGEGITAEQAEAFGSRVLGMSEEGYYAALCTAAKNLGPPELGIE